MKRSTPHDFNKCPILIVNNLEKSTQFHIAPLSTLGYGPGIANYNGIFGRYLYRSAIGHFRYN